jgi:hypothetical protein
VTRPWLITDWYHLESGGPTGFSPLIGPGWRIAFNNLRAPDHRDQQDWCRANSDGCLIERFREEPTTLRFASAECSASLGICLA